MKKIRVGVIGVGQMGRNHARIYSELPYAELVGVSDVKRSVAQSVAREYNTNAFTDYLKLLNENVDAVSIAVPTSLHKDVAVDVAEYGVDMLIEKPIADTTLNAREILKVAKKTGVKVMVGHIERFNPAVLKLREIVSSGMLGDILSMSGKRVGPYSPRIRDVGVIIDLAVHEIDTMSYLYDDKAVSVYAIGGRSGKCPHNFEDYASILLKFSKDRSGIVETNWLTSKKVRTLTVVGTNGVATLDYINKTIEVCKNGKINYVDINKSEPLKNEIEYFLKSISNGESPKPSGEDGFYVLLVAISAIRSYKGEQVVKLNKEIIK